MFIKYEPNTVVFGVGGKAFEMTADQAMDMSRMLKIASEKARGPMPDEINDQYIEFFAFPGI